MALPAPAPENDHLVAATDLPQPAELPQGTRVERRTQKTKRKLLNAALHLFAGQGVNATSVEEITDRADVGKGTFYRHFGSKEELLAALLDDSVSRLEKAITSACQGQPSLSATLDRFFEAGQRFFAGNRENLLLLADGRLLQGLAGQADSDAPGHVTPLVEFTERLLEPYMPRWVSPGQAHLFASAVFSMIVAFLSVGLLSMPPEELKKGAKGLKKAFVSSCVALMAQDL